MFQQLDVNQDGVLSREEFAAYAGFSQPAYSSAQPAPMFGGASNYVRANELSFTPPIQYSASAQMPAPTAYEPQPQIYSAPQPQPIYAQPASTYQPAPQAAPAQTTYAQQASFAPATYTAAPQTYTAPPMQLATDYAAPPTVARTDFAALSQPYSLTPPVEYAPMTMAPAQYSTQPAQYSMEYSAAPTQYTAAPAQATAAQYAAAPAQSTAAQYTAAPAQAAVAQYTAAPAQSTAAQYTAAPAQATAVQYSAAPPQTTAPQYMSQLGGGQYMTVGNPAANYGGTAYMPFGAKRETDVFAQMDVNGDGVLSREEFMASIHR